MANIQINQIQLPQLKELNSLQDTKVDKGFKFTLLSHIDEADLQQKLTEMVEKITEQGNKIAEHMDIRDVRLYRSMISDFLGEAVANSHKYSRENFLDRRGRHRVYGIVRAVNQKVDALVNELMRAEKNHMDILEKVGEIQGLLLDILT
ncbi:MAG: YaaR family protein [Cellulosilyticaceae bacterium]